MPTKFDSIPEGLVLRPSLAEFKNFREYIHKLETDPKLMDHGILKVTLIRLFPPSLSPGNSKKRTQRSKTKT
jgi:hypothetical protein